MRTVNFGVIGLGQMGREFASAVLRWAHLPEMKIRPQIISICSASLKPETEAWYRDALGTVRQSTKNYRELLANPDIEAVYCAVPHHLHEQMYCDVIRSGKHLFGEKPFGIDLKANKTILNCVQDHPEVFVRCTSQFPFAPAVQRFGSLLEKGFFGRILEVEAGFLHSSDLNPQKPVNWKRILRYNGEYGCMGDLGMHICHVPFRAGWIPKNVRAVLTNAVTRRPDGKGGTAACETWDNAVLLCDAEAGAVINTGPEPYRFPMILKTQRIAPGEKNTWYLTVKGMEGAAAFSTKDINSLRVLEYSGGEQAWQTIDMGHETAFPSITGGIFEFGFSDAMLQMWAAYLYELEEGTPFSLFSGCVTPGETALSHRLFTAALESQRTGHTIPVQAE